MTVTDDEWSGWSNHEVARRCAVSESLVRSLRTERSETTPSVVRTYTGRHGNFLPWLEAEFGWTPRTAQNIISVAEKFGDKYETVSHLGAKVLYALASDSTPEGIRVEFTELAELGYQM